MYKCTVILPTHHSHNFNREPESIVMEMYNNDTFKDQSSILVSCLDMRKYDCLYCFDVSKQNEEKTAKTKREK